jgi:hypothetical protein
LTHISNAKKGNIGRQLQGAKTLMIFPILLATLQARKLLAASSKCLVQTVSDKPPICMGGGGGDRYSLASEQQKVVFLHSATRVGLISCLMLPSRLRPRQSDVFHPPAACGTKIFRDYFCYHVQHSFSFLARLGIHTRFICASSHRA